MARDDDMESSLNPAGIYPFLRSLVGFHTFAGRGLFMFRSLVVGTTSAALVGTLCAIVGGMALGVGSIPFLIGASIGFQGGLWLHYNHSLLQAMVALHDFPSLLLLHLDANFPLYRWRQKKWSGELDGKRLGWLERSMLVTAWQSAGAAVEEIQLQKENAVVRDIVERQPHPLRFRKLHLDPCMIGLLPLNRSYDKPLRPEIKDSYI